MSDNGPQMRSHSTRQFMAACAIMQRFGRPDTLTDQAWIERGDTEKASSSRQRSGNDNVGCCEVFRPRGRAAR